MRRSLWSLAALAITLSAIPARAGAAPSNDDVASAREIWIPRTVGGTIMGATLEPGESRGGCPIERTVWYRFTIARPTPLAIFVHDRPLSWALYRDGPSRTQRVLCHPTSYGGGDGFVAGPGTYLVQVGIERGVPISPGAFRLTVGLGSGFPRAYTDGERAMTEVNLCVPIFFACIPAVGDTGVELGYPRRSTEACVSVQYNRRCATAETERPSGAPGIVDLRTPRLHSDGWIVRLTASAALNYAMACVTAGKDVRTGETLVTHRIRACDQVSTLTFDPAVWWARVAGSIPAAYTRFAFRHTDGRWMRTSASTRSVRATFDFEFRGHGDPEAAPVIDPGICYFPCAKIGVTFSRSASVSGKLRIDGNSIGSTLEHDTSARIAWFV